MDRDKLYATSIKLNFKEPDKYDWMTSLLMFGVCVYKTEVVDEEVRISFVPPYTREFDEALFIDDCNEDYIINDELIST